MPTAQHMESWEESDHGTILFYQNLALDRSVILCVGWNARPFETHTHTLIQSWGNLFPLSNKIRQRQALYLLSLH